MAPIEDNDELVHAVASLFLQLGQDYGAAFRTVVGNEDIRELSDRWAEALRSAGVTPEGVREGIRAVYRDQRFRRFPPRMAEFVALCPRPKLAVPDPDDAYRQACNASGRDLHPLVREAAIKVGQWELRTQGHPAVRERFIRAYTELMATRDWSQDALPPAQADGQRADNRPATPSREVPARLRRALLSSQGPA